MTFPSNHEYFNECQPHGWHSSLARALYYHEAISREDREEENIEDPSIHTH